MTDDIKDFISADGVHTGFSTALLRLKAGHRVCRAGWNGKGMWLQMVELSEYGVTLNDSNLLGYGKVFVSSNAAYNLLPWIGMKTADNKFVPWLCSQTDMLALDWEIVL